MGRPREHDDTTREALRIAAERLFEQHGTDGVSVRSVADAVGTSTRAVYALFGSKDGLVLDALAQRAYEILTAALNDHPETDDPVADLIDMAPSVFRRFVLDHPGLFRVTFQRAVPGFEPGPELLAARGAGLRRLTAKIQRVEQVGLLQHKPLRQAVIEYQAMCEGLGNFEMRGATMQMLEAGREEEIWRQAFTSLLATFT